MSLIELTRGTRSTRAQQHEHAPVNNSSPWDFAGGQRIATPAVLVEMAANPSVGGRPSHGLTSANPSGHADAEAHPVSATDLVMTSRVAWAARAWPLDAAPVATWWRVGGEADIGRSDCLFNRLMVSKVAATAPDVVDTGPYGLPLER